MTVRSFYGRYARLYDAVAGLPGVRRWRERAADTLELEPGDTVVEMGCGTGANLAHLRQRVGDGGRVVGVDLTRPLLRRAGARVDGADRPPVHLVHGDATRPPVVEADAVLATFVLGLLPDPAGAVETWCDLAGPGGRVAVLEATRSDRLGPANVAFDLFVRLSAPGRGAGASAALDERVRTAHAALAGRTVRRRHESFGLGLVDLLAGTVAATPTPGR